MTQRDSQNAESPASAVCNQRVADALPRRRNVLVFLAVAVAWFMLDLVTKNLAESHGLGEVFGGPFAGIFQFRLVHNTGAAWGMFSDMTILLGVFSLIVCAGMVLYLFFIAPNSSVAEALGLGFAFAGGLGNALDRFTLGYVVDFIEPVFINFPVFNVADIGVTCGIVVFLVALLYEWRTQ